MTKIMDICRFLDAFAPRTLAADWDNVGLLLGDSADPVERILTCLTVTPEVVSEAIDERVQLIVSHHPILFRGAKNLSTDRPDGRLLWPLARARVAVYSPHTAFDDTPGGINDMLASLFELTDVEPLRPREGGKKVKIAVFLPESDLTKVSDAMFSSGAGIIGQYRECSFRTPGIGTFFGGETTNPTVGQKGCRENAPELRVEVVCPEDVADRVIGAMRTAHSYEEPAFDVYPLQPIPDGGSGRVGRLRRPRTLLELAREAKEKLKSPGVQVVGEGALIVERLAIACGAAGEYLTDAARVKADCFLTGEMRFHDYLTAQSRGVSLLLPGHYATERPAIEMLARNLGQNFPDTRVWPSRRESTPEFWV